MATNISGVSISPALAINAISSNVILMTSAPTQETRKTIKLNQVTAKARATNVDKTEQYKHGPGKAQPTLEVECT